MTAVMGRYKILFDGQEIDQDKIYSMKLNYANSSPLNWGITICPQITVQLDKSVGIPNSLKIYCTRSTSELAALNLAEDMIMTSYEDDEYTSTIVYTDRMIELNEYYNWGNSKTIQTIVNEICARHNIIAPTISDNVVATMTLNYCQITEREFLGYVAECLGCYAKLSYGREDHVQTNLFIASGSYPNYVYVNRVKTLIKETTRYSYVAYENADIKVRLGCSNPYANGQTYYMNPNNMLMIKGSSSFRSHVVQTLANGFGVGGKEVITRYECEGFCKEWEADFEQQGVYYDIFWLIECPPTVRLTNDDHSMYDLMAFPNTSVEGELFGEWYGRFYIDDNSTQQFNGEQQNRLAISKLQ